LHGNGSLGVVSLTTPARFANGISFEAGHEWGLDAGRLRRASAAVGGGGAALGGMLAVSRLTDDGIRVHSRAVQTRLRGGMQWRAGEATTLALRASWAEDPEVEAPGALTLAEFAADPNAASPTSLTRNAGKQLSQQQLAASLTRRINSAVLDMTAWTLRRDLENPLAAPAPVPSTPTEGVWVGIDRAVHGVRSTLRIPIRTRFLASAGIDLQQMRDDRVNRRHVAGDVSGSAFLDQREVIREIGAFGQMAAFLGQGFTARIGTRHDRVTFTVDDRLADHTDGTRIMAAWSTGGSLAWQRNNIVLWLGAGSAF
jgi:hypothetical protein